MSRKTNKKNTNINWNDWTLWTVIGLIISISCCHYTTPIKYYYLHELYRRLYYLPIIIAAFRYSLTGGITTSVAIGLIYLPHVVFQWRGSFLDNFVRFNEIILYIIVGGVAGFLSMRLRNKTDQYRRTAEELRESYKRLEVQTFKLAEMESQLRAADRLAVLGELTASLAHEVRNPLGSIKGATDILKKRCFEDKTTQEFAGVLAKEVDRLNRVVENYLNLSRKISAHPKYSNISEIIRSVLTLVGPEIRKKQIKVEVDLPEEPLMTHTEEVEVQQVFLNLILNALAALDSGGQIQIEGKATDREIFVQVMDTGKGIPSDKLEKIFLPFYTTRKNGTGLGLAIVKRIMESSGGRIEVESKENEGSIFTLTFKKAK